jgi:rsbT co-antagonist protein RsbR
VSGSGPGEDEIAALRRRVAELSEEADEYRRRERRLLETEERLRRFLEATRDVVAVTERGFVVEVNQRFSDLFGYPPEEIVGRPAVLFHPPEHRDEIAARIRSGSEEPYEIVCLRRDGSTFIAEICGRAIAYEGRPARVTVIRDITERKRVEEATRAALVQRGVIEAQQAMLAQLSTPILPIGAGALVLPLIGAVSPERARQVIEALVEGVAANQATTAILDITGVPEVDDQVADALLRAARAAQLLGAEVVLTGIRPEVARRIVHAGNDFKRILTHGTLKQGVAHALKQRSRSEKT